MTLRDFLKANKSLTKFKKLYHERSNTKITYRQIEANLLTAGEDFIVNALNISINCGNYWIDLNTKWNEQLKPKPLSYWLKINNLEEKFKKAYLSQNPKCYSSLKQKLSSTNSAAISAAFTWNRTVEGFDFWLEQSTAWKKFCKK